MDSKSGRLQSRKKWWVNSEGDHGSSCENTLTIWSRTACCTGSGCAETWRPIRTSHPWGYMAQVLRNKLTDLMREQGAEKRGGGLGAISLDATVDGSEDGMTLAELLEASESTHAGEMGETHRHHVRMDLLRAMARLTPSQQRLCVMLGEEGLSVKEAAEQLRIPRGTLYEACRTSVGILSSVPFARSSVGGRSR